MKHIKIKHSGFSDHCWYNKFCGQSFEFITEDEDNYWVKIGDKMGSIEKVDGEIIEEEINTHPVLQDLLQQQKNEAQKPTELIKGALRYDTGKPRHDLIPAFSINELGKIYEMGAKKYADNNWRKGMKWSRVLGSLKRHLNAIERGEDFDEESKLYHAGHVIWNAITLLEYYKIYPQGDDRQHSYLERPKIGLDIDGVLADFTGALTKKFNFEGHNPIHWNDPIIRKLYPEISKDKQFWLDLPSLIKQEELSFEPHCYITSRSIGNDVSEEWLDKHGFPKATVYSIGHDESKVVIAKQSGIDIFVDDRYENFIELNKAGICCYLYDAPYNQKYEVGYKRIKSLKELI